MTQTALIPETTQAVEALYFSLHRAWNGRSAGAFAALFSPEGTVVGFDGSVVNQRMEIANHLGNIFMQHLPPAYVGKVRDVRLLSAGVAVLSAVAGMVPLGKDTLEPSLNAIQTLVAVHNGSRWEVALFQNTPAAFHGRPEESQLLTEELTALLATSTPAR